MTENDPSAQDSNSGHATPPRGTPSPRPDQGAAQPNPNPWAGQQGQSGSGLGQPPRSTPAEGVLFGTAAPGHQQQPHTAPQPEPGPAGQPVQPGIPGTATFPQAPTAVRERPRSGKLVAGVAVLALLVGGGAGFAGGYLGSDSASGGSTGVSALDAPKPAKQTGDAPAGTVESAAQKLAPSVVQLQVKGSSGAGEGSGFVLSTDGYIMTNNHVVASAANGGEIQAVFANGQRANAKVVGRDPTTDIAVVKVDGVSGLVPAELGRSDDLRVGQPVVAIGSPFELSGTVTSGIVSALNRPVRAGGSSGDQATVMNAVQTDAAINPGNSGGPLANMSGQVIGINSAIYSPQQGGGRGGSSEGGNVGIGFAIPIDQARRTADEIIKTGRATQTFIGAQVGDAQNGGAMIASVQPGSPAEKAGLKQGDVVTKFDDRTIENADALVASVRTRAPGETVKLTVGNSRTVDITLGGQPVEPR